MEYGFPVIKKEFFWNFLYSKECDVYVHYDIKCVQYLIKMWPNYARNKYD